MLDARRAKEKGYITLKEAAQLTDYSPDYIGQLIRSGKIKGEQVYCSVAWVTTPEEIERYRQGKVNQGKEELSPAPTTSVVSLQIPRPLLSGLVALLAFVLLVPTLLFITQVEASGDAVATSVDVEHE